MLFREKCLELATFDSSVFIMQIFIFVVFELCGDLQNTIQVFMPSVIKANVDGTLSLKI